METIPQRLQQKLDDSLTKIIKGVYRITNYDRNTYLIQLEGPSNYSLGIVKVFLKPCEDQMIHYAYRDGIGLSIVEKTKDDKSLAIKIQPFLKDGWYVGDFTLYLIEEP